jgi:hypothetical protein
MSTQDLIALAGTGMEVGPPEAQYPSDLPAVIGYARASSVDQSVEIQEAALQAAGADRLIFPARPL